MSCDLANDKVEEVLLAQVVAWSDAVRIGSAENPALKSQEFRRFLVAGNVPSLSLLRKRDAIPVLPWSVVDFRRLFTLPKPFVRRVAEAAGPRLRLLSPYREHLAQAFARYSCASACRTMPKRSSTKERLIPLESSSLLPQIRILPPILPAPHPRNSCTIRHNSDRQPRGRR